MAQNDTAISPLAGAQARRLKQQQAAQLMAGRDGLVDRKVAEVMGINRRTFTRWRQDPAFVAMVREASAAAWAKWDEQSAARQAEHDRAWHLKREQRSQREKAARRRRYLTRGV